MLIFTYMVWGYYAYCYTNVLFFSVDNLPTAHQGNNKGS